MMDKPEEELRRMATATQGRGCSSESNLAMWAIGEIDRLRDGIRALAKQKEDESEEQHERGNEWGATELLRDAEELRGLLGEDGG